MIDDGFVCSVDEAIDFGVQRGSTDKVAFTLAYEVRRLREENARLRSGFDELFAARVRIESRLEMQHDDSLVRVGDIKQDLRGD